MTNFELDDTVKVIARLFPKSAWTPELHRLFRERAARFEISVAQATAAIEEYRIGVRVRSPDVGTLIRRLKDAAFTGTTRTAAPSEPAAPREVRDFRRDPVHPGVLARVNGQDVLMSWENYAAKNGMTATRSRKQRPGRDQVRSKHRNRSPQVTTKPSEILRPLSEPCDDKLLTTARLKALCSTQYQTNGAKYDRLGSPEHPSPAWAHPESKAIRVPDTGDEVHDLLALALKVLEASREAGEK